MKRKQKDSDLTEKIEDESGKAIRNRYEALGVEGYYKQFGEGYSNPHFQQIQELIDRNLHRFDLSHALDLCCGAGEVSGVLQKHGHTTTASDPYTQAAFLENIGRTCLSYSFDDIIKGAFGGERFSTIFCSFALHLCDEPKLYPLVHQLLQPDNQFVVITPHKRPDLRTVDGVELNWVDFALTARGKKVHMNAYTLHRSVESLD